MTKQFRACWAKDDEARCGSPRPEHEYESVRLMVAELARVPGVVEAWVEQRTVTYTPWERP